MNNLKINRLIIIAIGTFSSIYLINTYAITIKPKKVTSFEIINKLESKAMLVKIKEKTSYTLVPYKKGIQPKIEPGQNMIIPFTPPLKGIILMDDVHRPKDIYQQEAVEFLSHIKNGSKITIKRDKNRKIFLAVE